MQVCENSKEYFLGQKLKVILEENMLTRREPENPDNPLCNILKIKENLRGCSRKEDLI